MNALLTLLLFTAGEPPAVIYPTSTVAAKKTEVDPWARVYAKVLAGETILTENVPGQPKGKYKCFLLNGTPSFQAISEVVASKAFPIRHNDHSCPNCGKSQYRIDSWLPSGEHQHRCSSCGTIWRH